jgi:hypothetical protein
MLIEIESKYQTHLVIDNFSHLHLDLFDLIDENIALSLTLIIIKVSFLIIERGRKRRREQSVSLMSIYRYHNGFQYVTL